MKGPGHDAGSEQSAGGLPFHTWQWCHDMAGLLCGLKTGGQRRTGMKHYLVAVPAVSLMARRKGRR